VPADPLRARLIAALRPRMTLVEAQVAVDGLLPTFLDYVTETVDEALRRAFTEQAELVGSVVSAAQDLLEADP
jgi:hypothetical protein